MPVGSGARRPHVAPQTAERAMKRAAGYRRRHRPMSGHLGPVRADRYVGPCFRDDRQLSGVAGTLFHVRSHLK